MTELACILEKIMKTGYIPQGSYSSKNMDKKFKLIPSIYNKPWQYKSIELGDTIIYLDEKKDYKGEKKKYKGVVVYIHPQKRYFTVDTGKWKECLYFDSDFKVCNSNKI